MKFVWFFGLVLLSFGLVCEVLSDFSESMMPSKQIRNRVHRTMRVNMRVGKRYGNSEYDEEVPTNTLYETTPDTDYTLTQTRNLDVLEDVPTVGISKRDFLLSPNRRMRLVFRPGKRNIQQEFLDNTTPNQGGNPGDDQLKAPKRRLRMLVRTGKRSHDTQKTLKTLEPYYTTDFKRSAPQFLLNPRVGKNDQTWKVHSLETLQKRSDPKATDLWFGPRIGRSNEETPEDIPWNYVILNGNHLSNLPVYKPNDVEDQLNEETTI